MSMPRDRVRLMGVCLLGLFVASGCSPLTAMQPPTTATLMPLALFPTVIPGDTPAPAATPAHIQTPAAPEPTSTPAEQAVPIVSVPSPLNLPISRAFPIPTPGMRAAEAELLFAAPIPSAAEILEWRPPPVPVPFALHPDDHYWLRRPIPSGHVDWGLDWYPYGGNGGGQWRIHRGMDFPNDPGTPVLAAGDGVVIAVKSDWYPTYFQVATPITDTLAAEQALLDQNSETNRTELETTPTVTTTRRLVGPYGNFVIIRHDWGWQGEPVYTLYGHLLEVFCQEGDHVAAGDLIAGVGNTGDSTGPHLHFEVRIGENHYGATRNPALWIAPYEEWGTLAGRVTTARGYELDNALVAVYPLDQEAEWDPNDPEARYVTTYASAYLNPDPFWQENFVVPDLQAGPYLLRVRAGGELLQATVQIRPGVTTLVRLHTGQQAVPTSTPQPAS